MKRHLSIAGALIALILLAVFQPIKLNTFFEKKQTDQASLGDRAPSANANYDIEVEENIKYDQVDGQELMLDLYRPKSSDQTARHPAVIAIHGGCYTHGSKSDMHSIARELAQSGFVVASVQYRLADPATKRNLFPAGLIDVHQSIRFLRQNAERFSIDPKRISSYGLSAGGTLAALVGVTSAKSRSGIEDQFSERVQSVVTFYGRHDFTHESDPNTMDCAEKALGAKRPSDPKDSDFARFIKASVTSHVDKMSARFFIFHGTKDEQVLPLHAERLASSLREKQIPYLRIYEQGARHGLSKASHQFARHLLMDVAGLRRFEPLHGQNLSKQPAQIEKSKSDFKYRIANSTDGFKKVIFHFQNHQPLNASKRESINIFLDDVPFLVEFAISNDGKHLVEEVCILTKRPELEVRVSPKEAASQIKYLEVLPLYESYFSNSTKGYSSE